MKAGRQRGRQAGRKGGREAGREGGREEGRKGWREREMVHPRLVYLYSLAGYPLRGNHQSVRFL